MALNQQQDADNAQPDRNQRRFRVRNQGKSIGSSPESSIRRETNRETVGASLCSFRK
jgi:hypothetical protein